MPELKPCPFCGGEAHITEITAGTGQAYYGVTCSNEMCLASRTNAVSRFAFEAAKAWNTRAYEEKNDANV